MALYKGPFLSGFYLREASRFEEWLLAEQERLTRRIATALQRLVADSLTRNDYSPGLGYARRFLQLDPLHEGGQRQLLRLLAANGDYDESLAQFEQYKRLLADEIGVEPEAATLELVAEIRAALDQALLWRDTVALRLGIALLDFWINYGDWLTGREYLDQALANYPNADPQLRARALLAFARLDMGRGAYRDASERLQQVQDLTAGTAEPWSRLVDAWATRYLATVAVQSSDFARAIELSSRSLQQFRSLGDRPGEIGALITLGLSQRDSGDFVAAGHTLSEVRELAQQLGYKSAIARTERNLGVLALYTGKMDQAIIRLRHSLEIFERLNDLPGTADNQCYLGLAELGRNNSLAAESWGQQSLNLARRLRSGFVIAGALFVLGGPPC